jgi:PKD domain/Secretion system C-terminal sorting domain
LFTSFSIKSNIWYLNPFLFYLSLSDIKNEMKKISTLLFTITCICNIAFAQITSTETFDGVQFPPSGWAIKPDSTPIANIWVRRTSGTNPTCNTKSGAAMARFSSRSYIGGTQQLLVSRPIDYTNRTASDSATISFWMYRDSINTNYDTLSIWLNNTDTLTASAQKISNIARYRGHAIPDTQVNNGWRFYTFIVPNTYIGNATTRVIFEGTSGSLAAGQGANIFIDQMSFTEYPAPCAGIPNMGNIIASTPIICGGSGASNLSLSMPSQAIGLVYNWVSATSPFGPYTSLGTAANANTGTIASTTYITCITTCTNSGLSDTTNIDSVVVSTNPLPTIATSPNPAVLCAGTTGVVITASGATTYTWLPATTLNTNIGATVIASPIANTQYTIVGADATGCSTSTTINVTLNNGPTLAMSAIPNDSMCVGGQTILNCIGGGPVGNGNIYLWSDGATTRRDTIVVTTSKYYTVMVTNAGGCTNKDSIYITALPVQTSGFSYTQVGNTFSFTDTTTNPKSWSWTFGDGINSNLKNPIYTYSTPGTYTVTLVVNGPCKRDTITKVVQIFPLSISSLRNNIKATCYPNPAKNVLHISLENDFIQSIHITNLIGQQMSKQTYTSNAKTAELSISTLPKGIYHAHIISNKGNAVVQFVKE